MGPSLRNRLSRRDEPFAEPVCIFLAAKADLEPEAHGPGDRSKVCRLDFLTSSQARISFMSRPKGVPTGVSIRILTAGSVRAITRSVGGQGGSAVGLSVSVIAWIRDAD